MTQKDQNFADWIKESGRTKKELFREFRKRGGSISWTRFELWAQLDGGTKNPKSLQILTEMTGIPAENLFRLHDNED